MTQEEVKRIGDKSFDIINKSLERITQNMDTRDEPEVEDEEDALDADDL